MKEKLRACKLAIVMLILFSTAAAGYEFGSKVKVGDEDTQRPLVDFGGSQVPINLLYWDIGSPAFFDEQDVVYLHFGLQTYVTPNDIRLCEFEDKLPGTKVAPGDPDAGKPLTLLPSGIITGIYFMDLYGTTMGYDPEDAVYVKTIPSMQGPNIITGTNDIRLCDITALINGSPEGYQAGDRVLDFQVDHSKPLLTMIAPWPAAGIVPPNWPGMASVKFYNKAGNVIGGVPVYDYDDDVYLDLPISYGPGTVTANDLRLSAVNEILI